MLLCHISTVADLEGNTNGNERMRVGIGTTKTLLCGVWLINTFVYIIKLIELVMTMEIKFEVKK